VIGILHVPFPLPQTPPSNYFHVAIVREPLAHVKCLIKQRWYLQ
jgi:hypothetical protein